MDVGTLLLVLLLLACPLMMVFMHRGGHGARPLGELRRQRDETDSEPARLEDAGVGGT